MTGMRVLVTGMGGELGTRVAQLLEARTDVDEIVGVDFVPPGDYKLIVAYRGTEVASTAWTS